MKITCRDLAENIHIVRASYRRACVLQDQSALVKLEMSGERVEMTDKIARLGMLCREQDFGRLRESCEILGELGDCEG